MKHILGVSAVALLLLVSGCAATLGPIEAIMYGVAFSNSTSISVVASQTKLAVSTYPGSNKGLVIDATNAPAGRSYSFIWGAGATILDTTWNDTAMTVTETPNNGGCNPPVVPLIFKSVITTCVLQSERTYAQVVALMQGSVVRTR